MYSLTQLIGCNFLVILLTLQWMNAQEFSAMFQSRAGTRTCLSYRLLIIKNEVKCFHFFVFMRLPNIQWNSGNMFASETST